VSGRGYGGVWGVDEGGRVTEGDEGLDGGGAGPTSYQVCRQGKMRVALD